MHQNLPWIFLHRFPVFDQLGTPHLVLIAYKGKKGLLITQQTPESNSVRVISNTHPRHLSPIRYLYNAVSGLSLACTIIYWKIFRVKESQARLCYVPDIKSPRPVTILTRRITYPMRMPYHKRNKSKVGVAWLIYLILASYSLPIRYQPIQSVFTYATINYIVDLYKRYLNMFGYQSCGYEEQITPQHVSQPTITLRSCCEQRQGLFC